MMVEETPENGDKEELFAELRRTLISQGEDPAIAVIGLIERAFPTLSQFDLDRLSLARTHLERNHSDRSPSPRILVSPPPSFEHDLGWMSEWHRVRGVRRAVDSNMVEAYEEFSRGLAAASEGSDVLGVAANRIMLSKFYDHFGGEDTELALASAALEGFTEAQCLYGVAMSYLVLGVIYKARQDWKAMFEYFHRALEVGIESGDEQMIMASTDAIAEYYVYQGDFTKALETLERVLGMIDHSKASYDLSSVKLKLASVYSGLGDEERAMAYAREATEVANRMARRGLELQSILNQAVILNRSGRFAKSIQIVSDVRSEIENAGNASMILYATRVLAHSQFGLGELDEALEETQKYLEARRGEVDGVGYQELKLLQVKIHRIQGTSKNLKDEIRQLISEINETDDAKDIAPLQQVVADAQEILIEIAESEGDYKEALRLYRESSRDRLLQKTEDQRRSVLAAEAEKTVAIERERAEQAKERAKQERRLLRKILPEDVAERMIMGQQIIADAFDNVSIMFLDLVDFTPIASRIPPTHIVYLLDGIFEACDEVMERHGLTQIKTIGDAYLAVAGVPYPIEDHVRSAANAAMELTEIIKKLEVTLPESLGSRTLAEEVGAINVRIGLHSGPLVAGVIGRTRVAYDIWGDAVNVAARMEATCEPGRVQVSESFALQLLGVSELTSDGKHVARHKDGFQIRSRGDVHVKGKGTMHTYWLEPHS